MATQCFLLIVPVSRIPDVSVYDSYCWYHKCRDMSQGLCQA